jgi:hypothetical protein
MPKPVKLKDFSGVSKDVIVTLGKHGITDTKKLFPFITTKNKRNDLSRKTGISDKEILELTKLTDLSRIQWVGANFARLLADSKCDTVKKVSQADYKKLYASIVAINTEKKYFRGKFGENDMKLCVLASRNVPDAVEY